MTSASRQRNASFVAFEEKAGYTMRRAPVRAEQKTVSEKELECRESALPGCSTERAVVRKERSAVQVSRSHLCMMFVLLPRQLRLCREDPIRASGSAKRLGRDRGGFSRSNEIVGILKQLKDETSADLSALEKGVGSEDQSPGSCE